jgi:hypothetical protein
MKLTDPLAIRVAEFISPFLQSKLEGLEIEGKIGFLHNRRTYNPFSLPHVASIVALDPKLSDTPWRFESNVPQERFAHLQNNVFTGRVHNYRATHAGMAVEYAKKRTRDAFYIVRGERVRVTRDMDTDKVLECIIKKKPEHCNLDFFNPSSEITFRISVSSEVKAPLPTHEQAVEIREKERRSYMIGFWTLDFTTVTSYSTSTPNHKAVTHEIEVEVLSKHLPYMNKMLERAKVGQISGFTEIASSLLDTLRMLTYLSHPQAPVPEICLPPRGDARPRPPQPGSSAAAAAALGAGPDVQLAPADAAGDAAAAVADAKASASTSADAPKAD